ncbi:Type I restriction-modification system specificity subunit [uncultured Candidatus Thioglobus sp.]|nr:Type I restriction-modification system specificity subunit [uncultured Candidatus Thioglobus sp.]
MKLKDIATIKTGLVLSRKKAALYEVKISYKQLTLKSFSNSTIVNSSTLDDFSSTDKIKPNYLTQKGDVVIRLRAPSVAIYIDKTMQGLVISSLMAVIRSNDLNINHRFLAHYLNSSIIQKVFNIAIKGTAIPMVKTSDIAELNIVLPSLTEQNKTVKIMSLLYKEQEVLKELSIKKQIFTQNILNTISNQFQEAK